MPALDLPHPNAHAANLLKPALARGDLHCIGATTGTAGPPVPPLSCRTGAVHALQRLPADLRGNACCPATAVEEYRKHIEQDGAFARRFQVHMCCLWPDACRAVGCTHWLSLPLQRQLLRRYTCQSGSARSHSCCPAARGCGGAFA